jgi:hypothetical protein
MKHYGNKQRTLGMERSRLNMELALSLRLPELTVEELERRYSRLAQSCPGWIARRLEEVRANGNRP